MIILTNKNFFQELKRFNIRCLECGSENVSLVVFPNKTTFVQVGQFFIQCEDCNCNETGIYCD